MRHLLTFLPILLRSGERRHQSYRDRSSPPPRTQSPARFADPFLLVDQDHGRRPRPINAREGYDAPEYIRRSEDAPPSLAASAIEHFVDVMKNLNIRAEDVDGNMFRNLPPVQLQALAVTTNIISAHILGALYDEKYQGEGFCQSLRTVLEMAKPGVIFTGPLHEQLCDDGVGIESLDRSNSIHGPSIQKLRVHMIIKRQGTDVQILSTTAFVDKGAPPDHIRNEYVRLRHRQDGSDPESARGLAVIQYSGSQVALPKVSFMRHTRPSWIHLERAPFRRKEQFYQPNSTRSLIC